MQSTNYSHNAELLLRYRNGDESAIDDLLTFNSGLIRTIALRFKERALQSHGCDFEDLTQLGAIGLIKAVKSFDTSYNTAFSTYAVPLIIGEIKRFLRDDGPVKISRSTKRLGALIMRVKEEFQIKHDREPTVDELCEICEVPREDLVFAIASARPLQSLNDTFCDDGLALEDTLSCDDDELESLCDRLSLREAIKTLPQIQQQIINLRYFRELSQQQTANILGLTQVKISREEKKIIEALRKQFA